MNYSPEEILGHKIQALRRSQGMTLQRLADRTNLSKSLLSKIENGKVSSPVSTLFKIARAFQAKVADFFDEMEGDTPLVLVKKGQGLKYREKMPYWLYECEALAYKRQNKLMEPFITTTNKRSAGKVFFTHPGEEFIFVLEGTIRFLHGAQEWTVRKGDCIYFDASVPHVAVSADGRLVRALMVSSAGGNGKGMPGGEFLFPENNK